mmetsp:Transcript_11113/g.29171  ORF Transcript_11113/g.29171 Transcript_11113/m.29171 type:complete len:140 (-) Transcript_11113:224-643(-)
MARFQELSKVFGEKMDYNTRTQAAMVEAREKVQSGKTSGLVMTTGRNSRVPERASLAPNSGKSPARFNASGLKSENLMRVKEMRKTNLLEEDVDEEEEGKEEEKEEEEASDSDSDFVDSDEEEEGGLSAEAPHIESVKE